MKKSKIILIGLVLTIAVLAVATFVYRYWFEFDNDEVKKFIQSEADKYGPNSQSVYKLIDENVKDILKDSDKARMVRTYAKATNLPIEKVLVDTAVAQAQALKFIA